MKIDLLKYVRKRYSVEMWSEYWGGDVKVLDHKNKIITHYDSVEHWLWDVLNESDVKWWWKHYYRRVRQEIVLRREQFNKYKESCKAAVRRSALSDSSKLLFKTEQMKKDFDELLAKRKQHIEDLAAGKFSDQFIPDNENPTIK